MTKDGPALPDPARLDDPSSVAEWMSALGCSELELQDAVLAVGSDFKAARHWLEIERAKRERL